MEVILLQDVDKLGTRGQVVKVADGYGRNHLLPKKIALAATPQNKKWVGQQRVRFLKMEAKEKADAEELAKIMEGTTVTVKRKSGEQGTLFGSVTAMDVAEGLAAQGYNIDKRKVQLETPLKLLGEYDVAVKLHREVVQTIKVKVESESPQPTLEAHAAEKSAAPTEEVGDKEGRPPARGEKKAKLE
jgi:large subunit ribosomal protein L9